MQRILLFTFMFLTLFSDAFSQCVTTILSSGLGNTTARCPMTRHKSSRAHYLITAAEMAAAGYTPGKAITGISWNYTVAPSVSGTGNLTVYLENSPDVTNIKSSSWASAISGMQTVHTAPVLLPASSGFFDINFTGGTPFTYTGDGLYVAFDWNYCAGPIDNTGEVGCNGALTGGLKFAQAIGSCINLPTLAPANGRPDTRFISAVLNDVKVEYVYTMGEIPLGYAPNQIIRARVTNSSPTPFVNYPVNLNISGANSFSNVQTISNLGACTSQTVSFAPFTPASIGVDTVRIDLPPDNNLLNNSMEAMHTITNNSYHYRYLGELPNTGVGFSGSTGAVMAKFTTNAPLTITHINVQFNSTGLPYKLAIYPDNAGNPGTIPVYVDANNRITNNGGPSDEMLNNPVVVPAGNFYVSVHQTGNANAAIIYAAEAPLRTGTFYFTSPLPAAFWIDLGPSNGSYRPLLGVKFCNQTTPDTIFGSTTVCAGSTNTYSVTPIFGAGSYTWTLPPGWTGSSNTNVIDVTSGNTSGVISCMVTYPCGNSGLVSLSVNVTPSSGILAPLTDSATQLHNDDLSINYYNDNCDLIATIDDAAGGNVLGSTTATVQVDPIAGFHNGQPFVRRWYRVVPGSNGSADVTLYLNQSDFDDYNSVVLPPYLPLPTSGNNADPNVANISITKNGDGGLGDNPVVIIPTLNWNGNYWEVSFNTPAFSQFRVHSINGGNIPLPASITGFTGKKLETSDELRWTSSNEHNNAWFHLQHSVNGKDFKTISKLKSKAPNGNSSVNLSYVATHNNPVTGQNYYRLQQVDIDGKSSYHANVISLLRGKAETTVNIYPNPVKEILNVDIFTPGTENTLVKVLNMEGRTVLQTQAKSVSGLNNITLNLGGLPVETYTVQVYVNGKLLVTDKVKKSE